LSYSTISYNTKNHIAAVTVNRLNLEMAQELAEVCRLINQDEAVYVVTVTGSGDAFCSFGDGEPGDLPPCRPAAAIFAIEKPVIAAVNGDALGLGLELALSCDIRLAADKARFGFPGVAEGLMPAEGGTQRLPRIVGRGKALEMILTGETITAKEALEIGLVSKIVPRKELLAEAEALAGDIAAKGPIALRFIKEAVNKGLDLTLEQGLRLEGDLYFLLHTTADRTEGITSFLGKRKPKFKGK
jgi:enoyl-CoA hydratase